MKRLLTAIAVAVLVSGVAHAAQPALSDDAEMVGRAITFMDKCDEYTKMPYGGHVHAFAELVKEKLTADDVKRAEGFGLEEMRKYGAARWCPLVKNVFIKAFEKSGF